MARNQRAGLIGIAAIALAGCPSFSADYIACKQDSQCPTGHFCGDAGFCAAGNKPEIDAGSDLYCRPCATNLDCGADSESGPSSSGNYCEFGGCATACANDGVCPVGAYCGDIAYLTGSSVGTGTACMPLAGPCPGPEGEEDAGVDGGERADSGTSLDAGQAGCLSDAGFCSGATPICDPATGACTGCLPTANACPVDEYCAPTGSEYGCAFGCASASNCPALDGGVAACCSSICVDTVNSAFNCGACGMTCATGDECCNSTCADELDDPMNCGACGNVCPSITNGTASCTSGVCATRCDTHYSLCGGACVDTSTDAANCGVCGMTCSAGETCTNGSCACTSTCNGECTNTTDDSENCGSCGNVCPSGSACAAGACKCADNGAMCSNACPDYQTDPLNCGSCGWACGLSETCSDGLCTCPSGGIACTSGCPDLETDPNNCGACGRVCATNEVCSGGACACTTAGSAECNAQCVDLQIDTSNCGGCGRACSAPTSACVAGTCVCPGGGVLCSGVCIDPCSDPENCGSCGYACQYTFLGCSGGCCNDNDFCTKPNGQCTQ